MYVFLYMYVCVCNKWEEELFFQFHKRSVFIFVICCAMLSCFSHVWLFVTLWTVALQAPLSMGFSRQEYWSGLPCPPPGDLPNPGIKPASPVALRCRHILYHWVTREAHPCYILVKIKMILFFQEAPRIHSNTYICTENIVPKCTMWIPHFFPWLLHFSDYEFNLCFEKLYFFSYWFAQLYSYYTALSFKKLCRKIPFPLAIEF